MGIGVGRRAGHMTCDRGGQLTQLNQGLVRARGAGTRRGSSSAACRECKRDADKRELLAHQLLLSALCSFS